MEAKRNQIRAKKRHGLTVRNRTRKREVTDVKTSFFWLLQRRVGVFPSTRSKMSKSTRSKMSKSTHPI